MTALVQPFEPPARSRTQQFLSEGDEHALKPRSRSPNADLDDIYSGMFGMNDAIDEDRDEDEDGDQGMRPYDITFAHHKICEYLEQNLLKMRVLHGHLELKIDVLSQPGSEGTFIHVLVDHMKKLLSDGKKKRYQNWRGAIQGIIPWVVFKHPHLLTWSDSSHTTAFETAFEKCIDVAYCILDLLLGEEIQGQIKMSCDRGSVDPCSMKSSHLLVLLFKSMAAGQQQWCAHDDRDKILECHRVLEASIQNSLNTKDDLKNNCLHYAIKEYLKPRLQDSKALEKLSTIIELIVQICPKALYETSMSGNTVYKELLSYDTASDVKDWPKNPRVPVLDILKKAIIGDPERQHSEKLKDLYPPGVTEHKICLDLGTSRPIGSKFIDAVIKQTFENINFETALSYICLPPRILSTAVNAQTETDTLATYERIFAFLRDRNVTKIFKVIVNDLAGRPHTDEMITKLIKGFDVEHWEWKKLDMNIETILEAAPNVKTVSLHSSGSYSALQGWASEDGLIKLQNGVETEKSLENYQKRFEGVFWKRFGSRSGLKLDVRTGNSITDEADNSVHQENRALARQEKVNHDWIRHMERFVQGLRNLVDEYDEQSVVSKLKVKVALIDDGIDPVKMRFKVADGRSFSEDEHASHDNYYVEAGPHGTVMASLINKMCPMVELYVAKIVPGNSGVIPPTAAAQAVNWAVEKGADIISMSWTFNHDANGADEFKKAIELAAQQNVLLFSSLRETENAVVVEKIYPVSLPLVFKIGSATRTGNQAQSYSGDSNSADFILPGREVLVRNGTETAEAQGSSIATALASGLAALIIFCADLVNTIYPNEKTWEREKLRQQPNMKYAFVNMSRQSNDTKYPEVQKYFTISDEDLDLTDIKNTITSLMAGKGN
ncbi:Subtilisin DY-like protein [Cladobotryum mycophilum]|uniref:Subtilisin DY-like protein n=1 Tax=Cladobotryum mycophilum TaxID=491253 RepID=A0ABR0SAA9_9HYPO